jgi:plasmid maintenance system antidote protein VapI
MDFKQRIKDKGIKKKKVAEEIGCTPEHLSRVLSGKTPLSIDLEIRLKKYLN